MIFQSFAAVTFSVSAYDASVAAAQSALGYQLVEESTVTAAQAGLWGAPKMAGQRLALLEPQSGPATYIRYIESPSSAAFEPLKTYGWNAAELHVQDVQGIAKKLDGGPYTIMGGPTDLMNNGAVVAMQICGPSNEMFYLAEINNERMRHVYGQAHTPIDRVFMAILGSREHEETRKFYSPFSNVTKARRSPLRILASAHGLDPETTKFQVCAAAFESQCRIEIDGYPHSAAMRETPQGEIPPGLAMASIYVSALDDLLSSAQTQRHALGGPPYNAHQAMMMRGPSGEWLELIEAIQPGDV